MEAELIDLRQINAKNGVAYTMASSDHLFNDNYMDYAFYDLLDTLPEELRLMRYCHPALTLIWDYDQRKGLNSMKHCSPIRLQALIRTGRQKFFICTARDRSA